MPSVLRPESLRILAETWVFTGKTKRSRWSMIGQAMPPPLAEAVGRSIVRALRRTVAA